MTTSVLIEEAARLIHNRKLSIAFAESATAGKLFYEFSQTRYSGDILKGGIVCYNAVVKEKVLGIRKEIVDIYTPESAEVTKEMAVQIKALIETDIAVAVTGLTTPGGSEHPGKPVGTMFYCVLLGEQTIQRKKIFDGNPAMIINLTIEQIAKTLLQIL